MAYGNIGHFILHVENIRLYMFLMTKNRQWILLPEKCNLAGKMFKSTGFKGGGRLRVNKRVLAEKWESQFDTVQVEWDRRMGNQCFFFLNSFLLAAAGGCGSPSHFLLSPPPPVITSCSILPPGECGHPERCCVLWALCLGWYRNLGPWKMKY